MSFLPRFLLFDVFYGLFSRGVSVLSIYGVYLFLAMLFYRLLILLWFDMLIFVMINLLLRTNVSLFFCGFNHNHINLASISWLISMSHQLFASPASCVLSSNWCAVRVTGFKENVPKRKLGKMPMPLQLRRRLRDS